MCGRFTLTQADPHAIQQQFALSSAPADLHPRYNIAPTQAILAVTGAEAEWLRWGIVPAWAKEAKPKPLINARAETILEKPTFRKLFQTQRCLIVADGFYEWVTDEHNQRQPMFIRLEGQPVFAMGGLWSFDKATQQTQCSIITTSANPAMEAIHHRMPVIVGPHHYADWLTHDPEHLAAIHALCQPFEGPLQISAASPQVNFAAQDDPSLLIAPTRLL